jgi:hypothetical protein
MRIGRLRYAHRLIAYADPMDPRAQAVKDALDVVARIDDPEERARVTGEVLEILHTGNSSFAALRRGDIQTLRAAGRSYRNIAEAIGVHFTRVRQIETGMPMGNSARSRAAKETADE